jgi:hypothetical protein
MNWKEVAVAYSMHYPNICLERLRKTTKYINQDTRYPCRNSKRTLPEYNARALLDKWCPTYEIWTKSFPMVLPILLVVPGNLIYLYLENCCK